VLKDSSFSTLEAFVLISTGKSTGKSTGTSTGTSTGKSTGKSTGNTNNTLPVHALAQVYSQSAKRLVFFNI
jgi:hypothetical protein